VPPFQYQNYSSPYANTIAQLLAHQGDPAAQAAVTVAAANARAGEQVAQAYGGVAQGIANAGSNVMQQILHQQEIAPQLETQKINLQNLQDKQRGQQALSTALAGDTLAPTDVGPRTPSFMTADGTYDITSLGKWLAGRGLGDQAPELLQQASSINDSMQKATAARQEVAKQQMILHGNLAAGALSLATTVGMPVDGAMDFVVKGPMSQGLINADDYAKFKQQITSLPPDQQIQALKTLTQQAGRLQPERNVPKEGTVFDVYGNVIAKGQATPPKPEAGVVYKDDKGVEHPVMATADGKYTYNGQDVTADVTRPAAQKTLTPEELNEDAYARDVLHKADRTQMTDAERQAFNARTNQLASAKQIATHAAERQYDINNPLPPPVFDQNRGERELVNRVMRVISSRSGDLGTQNARVSDANAGLGQFEQYLDLKTGEYHIPQSALNDLSMKVARLVSGGGNVGVEAMKKFETATLKGDIAQALTYIGGDPKDAATKGVAQVLIDILKTQGNLAATQRDKYLKEFVLRTAPMELDQERVDHVSKVKLPPVRVTRTGRLANGDLALFVSTDDGATWQIAKKQTP
jgi:hypothetical protein